jgi:hypothetical protein
LALVSKTRKGKGKSLNKKGNSDGVSSKLGKNMDLSKIMCFSGHKNGHYASRCLERNKKRGNMQKEASLEKQLDEVVVNFEKDFSLVSFLSTITTTKSVWHFDNGASHHMI